MEANLGISKVQFGVFFTIHSLIYGASRFVNGLQVQYHSA